MNLSWACAFAAMSLLKFFQVESSRVTFIYKYFKMLFTYMYIVK